MVQQIEILKPDAVAFKSRADAIAATVSDEIVKISVRHAGRVLDYVAGSSTGSALTTNGGTRHWHPADRITNLHYDGNLVSAIDLAQAGNRPVELTSSVTFTGGLGVSGAAPLSIKSDDRNVTLTRAQSTQTGVNWLFRTAQGVDLQDMSFTAQVDPTAGLDLFLFHSDTPVRISNVNIDMNVERIEGVRNWSGNIMHHAANGVDVDGIEIFFSHFQNFNWFILKPNNTQNNQKRFKYVGLTIENADQTPFLFNSPHPNSSIEDIYIAGNTVRDVRPTIHKGSFAGPNILGGRVVGNFYTGTGNEFFRMEEGAHYHSFAHNVAICSGENGFETISNDAVGTGVHTPHDVSFIGNILAAVDGAFGWAIQAGDTPLRPGILASDFSHNILTGEDWEAGLNLSSRADVSQHTHNIIKNTPIALRLSRPTLSVDDSFLIDNETPMRTGRGGLAGRINIRSLSGIPTCPDQMVIEVNNPGPSGFYGLTWETGLFTTSAGETIIDIVPMGWHFDCEATFIFTGRNNAYQMKKGKLTWDGSTLAFDNSMNRGTGDITMSDPANSSGKLSVTLNNSGGELTNCGLQVVLDGVLLWKA